MRNAANKRQRLPVTVGYARDETLTATRTPIVLDHLRRDRGLVDRDDRGGQYEICRPAPSLHLVEDSTRER